MTLRDARRAARRDRRSGGRRRTARLPDDAFVVRGGTCRKRDLLNAAIVTHEKVGEWAVSATAGVETPWEDLAATLPHPQVSVTSAGRLRAAGFEVALTGKAPHCTVYFGVDPTDDEAVIDKLRQAFDAPVPNPRRKST